jgi:hypothetical protein
MKPTTNNFTKLALAGLLAISLGIAKPAKAQLTNSSLHSSKAAIQLNATLPAQLRLSLSDINLDIKVSDPTQSSTVVAVPVTSSWVLDTTSNNVELVGYFDSPAAAMSDNQGHSIPANHVLGGLAEESLTPFVESSRVGTANASRTFFRQQISQHNVADTRTDTLNIQLSRIDDLGAPAAEYRGILHLRLVSY